MSTRSTIAIRRGPTVIESIYCHFDGYPEGVGKKLLEHYASAEKAESLIALGNLSCLREEAGDPNAKDPTRFDSRPKADLAFFAGVSGREPREDLHPTWSMAYGRDRGEVGQEARTTTDHESFRRLCDDRDSEFVYLWQDGAWHFADTYRDSKGWSPLTAEAWATRVGDE